MIRRKLAGIIRCRDQIVSKIQGLVLRYRPFLCPHVIVETVHGAEVGKGALVALGHGGQLLVVEPKGERLALI